MSKKNQRGGKGYVSQNKSKEAKTLHYKKEVARENARRDAINAGKSQATADRAGARAEKAVTGNKVNNLQEKREINAAARKEATVKSTSQKLSYWERAKQAAKSAKDKVKQVASAANNKVRQAAKGAKQTVSSAMGKVKGVANSAAGKVKQVANGAKQTVKSAAGKVKGAASTAAGKVKQVANGAKQTVKSAAGKVKGAASSAAGKVKQVAGAAAGKVKQVANVAKGKVGAAMGKYGPKALKGLKWGSKRIPIVCSVIGVAEAGYYAYKGEWGKAGVALGSGIVSNFPPYGTAAGIAMEAGVVAYDMYESHKQEEARRAEFEKGFGPAEAETKQTQKQQQKTNANTIEIDNKTQTKTEDKAQHTSSVRDVRQTMHRDQQHSSNADVTGAQSQTNQQAEQQAQQQQIQREQQQQVQQQQAQQQQVQQQQAQQQTQREQDGFNGSSTVSAANKGDEIVVSYGDDQKYTISKEDLKARMGMSSRRAKGTMEKLQGAIAANSNTEGVRDAVSTYVPELKKDGNGTAKVNRNLVDSTVKAIGGSSKATSITIDGKKIKSKDIQASYGCSKKEAKQILKAYGRAIEDGANLDDVLRDIASGKKLDTTNQAPANNNEAMRAMMARRTMRGFS